MKPKFRTVIKGFPVQKNIILYQIRITYLRIIQEFLPILNQKFLNDKNSYNPFIVSWSRNFNFMQLIQLGKKKTTHNFIYKFLLVILFSVFYLPQSFGQNKIDQNNQTFAKGNQRPVLSIGQVSVKTWADDKKSAFSFTFDDGYMSQYTYAAPVLQQNGFHATYFLIANSITDGPPAIYRYGYWSQFQELLAQGNEIGDHTMTHADLTKLPVGDDTTPNTIIYELIHSKQIIEQKIPGSKLISLAYPYGSYNSTVASAASQYYESARTVGGFVQSQSVNGAGWYGLLSGDVRFDQPRNVLADDQDELASYLNVLQNQTIANGQWSIFLAHEFAPFANIANGTGGDYFPVSVEWLTSLCQWLKQKSDSNFVWVETLGNVTRYIKERQNFSYNLISSTNSQIQFSPVDGLDDSIYNYPLTVDVAVPSNWQNVQAVQGNNNSEVNTFSDGSNTYARIHVIPDGGVVTLSNSLSSFEISGLVTYDNSSETPLANVTVTLKNSTDSLTTITDLNGHYSFVNLSSGIYTLTASKTGGWGGANSTDALLAARYFSNLSSLDSLQIKAADVNNNGLVNSTDALLIARRFINLINSFSKPDWIFSTPISITLSGSSVVQNIKALTAGDVNKSFVP